MMLLSVLLFGLVQQVPAASCHLRTGSWVMPEDYPADSLRAHEEGRVVFELDVDLEGCVTACRILKSSKRPLLDAATCDALMRRARFQPGVDDHGNPAATHYRNALIWRITHGQPQPDFEKPRRVF